jgi:hypothetical protein
MTCFAGLCVREAGDAGTEPCVPKTCEELRAQCGTIDDGCGEPLDCGTCTAPEECGAGGIPNLCDCPRRTCESDECGTLPDGCGGTIDCGGCSGNDTCGSDGRCQCTRDTCGPDDCGTLPDGCGGTIDCGGCDGGETCGAAGPNRCGVGDCTPIAACPAGLDCGPYSDGCGDVIDCGTCAAPETCGGGPDGEREPNVCGCTPEACADLGAQCGTPADVCGNALDCGTCEPPTECSSDFRCVCTPPTCMPGQCGRLANPCGADIVCDCDPGNECISGTCCPLDPAEPNDTVGTAHAWADLALGDQRRITDFAIHAENPDWFVGSLVGDPSGSGTYELQVDLGQIPSGEDYDLEVWIACGDATGGSLTCVDTSDLTSGGPVDATGGCRAETTGDADEVVRLFTSCQPVRFWVLVDPRASGACAPPYELDLRYQFNAITGGG